MADLATLTNAELAAEIAKELPDEDTTPAPMAAVGDCACSFSPAVQIDCIKHVVGMATGSVEFNTGDALKHVGCILGSAGALLSPQDNPVFAAEDGAEAIPPWLLPMLPYLFQILQNLLKK